MRRLDAAFAPVVARGADPGAVWLLGRAVAETAGLPPAPILNPESWIPNTAPPGASPPPLRLKVVTFYVISPESFYVLRKTG